MAKKIYNSHAEKKTEILTPSNAASGGSMTGECAQHTPRVCLKFMNSSYQQDCTPSRPKQVLIVTLPAGCAVQHQRAWLMQSLLVLHWPKQNTWQGMTQFWRSCFLTSWKTWDLLKRRHRGIRELKQPRRRKGGGRPEVK